MAIDTVNDLLARLGELLGMGRLQLDAEGALGLNIDGRLTLGVQYDPNRERLLIYADLGPLPAPPIQESLMTRMLQANLFGRLTAGGALALAPDLDPDKPLRIVLWKATDVAALDLPTLEHGLRQLADAVEDWQDVLLEWTTETIHEEKTAHFAFDPSLGIRV
jgi:hypothetical protein